MDYRRLLTGLIDELRANDALVLEDHHLGRGLTAAQARTLASEHGLTLADPLVEFFTQINGAVIQWRLAPAGAGRLALRRPADADSIRGFAYFYTLDELLPERASLQGTPFAEGLSDRARLRAFRPFDKNVEEAFAGFMVRGQRLDDSVVYLRQYEDLVALNAHLGQYLQALVEARAFLWWQEAFAARPGGRTADLYHYVPQLFPGATLDRFR